MHFTTLFTVGLVSAAFAAPTRTTFKTYDLEEFTNEALVYQNPALANLDASTDVKAEQDAMCNMFTNSCWELHYAFTPATGLYVPYAKCIPTENNAVKAQCVLRNPSGDLSNTMKMMNDLYHYWTKLAN